MSGELFESIEMQAADYRYRYRLAPDTRLTVEVPEWMLAKYSAEEFQQSANRLRCIISVLSAYGELVPVAIFRPQEQA